MDPNLYINDQHIPFASESVKFLGMIIEVPHNVAKSKHILESNLQRMLDCVNFCPLTRRQKTEAEDVYIELECADVYHGC